MNEVQTLEAIVRLLGLKEIRMKKGMHIGLRISLLLGSSTSSVLRSWYWYPVWLQIKGKDFRQMWVNCDRGDWLLWFCTHMIGQPEWPTHQEIVRASCQCARLALPHIKPPERRPLQAIEAAEAWAFGQATLEHVQRAGHAANCTSGNGDDAAYLAAQAAYSAAWAVYATEDGDCFRRAQAASGGADRAASAASHQLFSARLAAHDFSSETRAAEDRVEKAVLRECAEIVRHLLKVPEHLTTEFAILHRTITKPATKPTGTDNLWLKGYNALERGKELYFQNQFQEALPYFDTAIESGFEGAEAYGLRGGCLQFLHFDLDSIDAFTKAIEYDSEDSNNYFMRSISKMAVGDQHGCIEDLNEAIRLANIDSASTRIYNANARENGYKDGIAGMYRMQLLQANIVLDCKEFEHIANSNNHTRRSTTDTTSR